MYIFKFGFFLLTLGCFGQQVYVFDTSIEYDFYWKLNTLQPSKYYYLTNSQNNDYTAVLTEKDSLTYKLDFLDQNGIHAVQYVLKSNYKKRKGFTLKCSKVKPHANTKKSLIKRHNFVILKDTFINGKPFGHYILKSEKSLATEHYIVDTTFRDHLPTLRYATAFDKWKTDKILPNGIIIEKFLKGGNGKKRHRLVLRKHDVISKSITIPEDCDYTQ